MADSTWKPGQSGNPKGRPPKGETFTSVLESVLREETVTYNGKLISGKEAAARKLLAMAMNGNVIALKYLADRIDGSPAQTQSIELSGINGDPILAMVNGMTYEQAKEMVMRMRAEDGE